MKELSIEEKAKRYDEAFEIAKEINNEHKAQPFDVMLKVFPELKESEDEMIRMSLIELFKDMEWDDSILHDYNMDKDKTIAWLEKQGEHVEINPTEFDTRLQTLIGKFNSLPKKELIGSLSFWLNVVQNDGTYIEEKQGEHSIYNVPSREVILAIWDLGNEWKELTNGSISTEYGTQLDYIQKHWHESEYYLKEKQGEQKHVPYWMPKFLDKLRSKKNYFDWDEHKDIEGGILAIIKWMNPNYFNKKDGEQKSDKIEPKFHKGDWIVFNGLILLVNEVVQGYYRTISIGGIPNSYDWSIDNAARLWTIQDAKDGDVLFQDLMGGKTFIYNGINPSMAILYSFIISNDGEDVLPYHIGKPNTGIGNIEENKNIIRPATKEQRDTLEKAITNAGYRWDKEKLKLEKV